MWSNFKNKKNENQNFVGVKEVFLSHNAIFFTIKVFSVYFDFQGIYSTFLERWCPMLVAAVFGWVDLTISHFIKSMISIQCSLQTYFPLLWLRGFLRIAKGLTDGTLSMQKLRGWEKALSGAGFRFWGLRIFGNLREVQFQLDDGLLWLIAGVWCDTLDCLALS